MVVSQVVEPELQTDDLSVNSAVETLTEPVVTPLSVEMTVQVEPELGIDELSDDSDLDVISDEVKKSPAFVPDPAVWNTVSEPTAALHQVDELPVKTDLIEDCDVVSIAASLQNQCVVAASAKKPAVVVLPRMADKRKTATNSKHEVVDSVVAPSMKNVVVLPQLAGRRSLGSISCAVSCNANLSVQRTRSGAKQQKLSGIENTGAICYISSAIQVMLISYSVSHFNSCLNVFI
jgi:hypothetical protein